MMLFAKLVAHVVLATGRLIEATGFGEVIDAIIGMNEGRRKRRLIRSAVAAGLITLIPRAAYAGIGEWIDTLIGLNVGQRKRSIIVGRMLAPFRRDTAHRMIEHLG